MSEPSGTRLSERTIYRGRIFTVTNERVLLPQGREVDLDIVRHPGSVVLIPMPTPGRVILVRQYRHAVGRSMWELPAGSIDPGETAETAARRECHEEIGLVPDRVESLGVFLPTPGYCDETMQFFRVSGLRTTREAAAHDEDEALVPQTFDVSEALDMVRTGAIDDLKTAFGLTLVR